MQEEIVQIEELHGSADVQVLWIKRRQCKSKSLMAVLASLSSDKRENCAKSNKLYGSAHICGKSEDGAKERAIYMAVLSFWMEIGL